MSAGANCTQQATSIESVMPSEGYFLGGGTRTTFFECLNNACGPTGCISPYSGSYCTECDGNPSRTGLVLNKNFECETCPSIGVLVCFVLLLISLVLLFIVYKVRDHGTPANVDRNVWFKIVASSFQVNAITTAAFQWSSAIDVYFETQGDVSSLGVSYFNLACFSSSFLRRCFSYYLRSS